MKDQTFKPHACFTASCKPTRWTLLAVRESNDTHVTLSTDERLVVLNSALEEPLTTLT